VYREDRFFFSIIGGTLAGCVALIVGSPSNKEWVQERAEARFEAAGYQIVNYQGFKWGGLGYGTPYGGAEVWYELRKPGSATTYQAHLQRWGEETHIYDLTAIDAIRPNATK